MSCHLLWAQWSLSAAWCGFETDDSIESLSLQHYPGMTEKLLAGDCGPGQPALEFNWYQGDTSGREAAARGPGVFVGVASEHRADAFEAAQFLMDYLKTRATFWKQVSQDGQQHWIESKQSIQWQRIGGVGMKTDIDGLVLAAGRSSRMHSNNKVRAVLAGKPLLDHVIDRSLLRSTSCLSMEIPRPVVSAPIVLSGIKV